MKEGNVYMSKIVQHHALNRLKTLWGTENEHIDVNKSLLDLWNTFPALKWLVRILMHNAVVKLSLEDIAL